MPLCRPGSGKNRHPIAPLADWQLQQCLRQKLRLCLIFRPRIDRHYSIRRRICGLGGLAAKNTWVKEGTGTEAGASPLP